MPPTRRSIRSTANGPAGKGSQSTLSFSTNVTKSVPSGKNKLLADPSPFPTKKDAAHDLKDKPVVIEDEETKLKLVEEVEVEEGEEEEDEEEEEEEVEEKIQSEIERRALGVSDAQVRRYWRDREAERMAARVHQMDLSVEEKALRLFDMSSQYGPCIGITRRARWHRAHDLNLEPPIEVLAILLKDDEARGPSTSTSTSAPARSIERAHVDRLMANKGVVGAA